MAGNKFNRYLWLINLLQTRGPIPYKEISNQWEKSIYNDKPGEGLPLKTFHNHCGVIAEIFGVDVECEKGGQYGYYIQEPAESEVWKFKMLNNLLLHAALKDNPEIAERVKNLDQSTWEDLPTIIECVQKQAVVSFVKPGVVIKNGKPTLALSRQERMEFGKHYSNFLVLAAVEVHYQWYVIGAFVERDNPFGKWQTAVFESNHMWEITIQYESQLESENSFSLQNFIDSFVYDKANPIDDDGYYFGQALRYHKARLKYGRPVRYREK